MKKHLKGEESISFSLSNRETMVKSIVTSGFSRVSVSISSQSTLWCSILVLELMTMRSLNFTNTWSIMRIVEDAAERSKSTFQHTGGLMWVTWLKQHSFTSTSWVTLLISVARASSGITQYFLEHTHCLDGKQFREDLWTSSSSWSIVT